MRKQHDTNYQIGLTAEDKCREHLEKAGFNVLASRHKTACGEIDIIARKDDVMAFIEVKKRKSAFLDDPISPAQKKRIANAALQYIAEHPEISALDMRFDCIFVDSDFGLNHIEDAWRAES